MEYPIAIIWHSRTGAARAMAEAIAEGAGGAAAQISAETAEAAALLSVKVFLFVCPENLGGLSGPMKDMFDRNYYPLLGHIEGRSYATAIAAGSAGQGAEAQIDRIVTGWRLRRIAESLIVNLDAQTPEAIQAPKLLTETDFQRCRQLGEAVTAGLELGIF